jgi:hypothetical protein
MESNQQFGGNDEQGLALAHGTGRCTRVTNCQVCGNPELQTVVFLGYLPPVNKMVKIGTQPFEQAAYPAELLYCQVCRLVQLGLIVDPEILFPPEYPYTSSTTRILRENFAELYSECRRFVDLGGDDLVVDIGSNDGNLLSNFVDNHRVTGVTPEEIGRLAIEKGIPTIIDYFNDRSVGQILETQGPAKLVTATNVFAHMENIHQVVRCVDSLLSDDKGVFISESHYWLPLVETLQYDTIYHEHMRYYSLTSIKYLLDQHGFEVFNAKRIPTHGGSIRVYAARSGQYEIQPSIAELLEEEAGVLTMDCMARFKSDVLQSKLALNALLKDIKAEGKSVYGIAAPSRASTLVNYCGLDDGSIDCVVEVPGSHKIGNYMPGTIIPIVDEQLLFENQPDYAMLLAWHIADELAPILRAKGFKGKFIVPLPKPGIMAL